MLALVKHDDDASGRRVVEEIVGQQNDALDEIAVDKPPTDVSFFVLVLRARAAGDSARVEDNGCAAGFLQHRQRVLEPGPVAFARGRATMLDEAVVGVVLEDARFERLIPHRVGDDEVELVEGSR